MTTARGSYRGTGQTRARIVAAAAEVFAAGGYDAASLRSIAAAAGMSHPGVLHHFPTKEHLLDAVLTAQEEAERRVFEAADPPTTVEGLAQALARAIAVDRQQVSLVRLRTRLAAAGGDPAHPAHAFTARRHARLTQELARGLEPLYADGQLRGRPGPEKMAVLLLALVDGLLARGLVEPDLDTPALVRQAVLGLLGTGAAGAGADRPRTT